MHRAYGILAAVLDVAVRDRRIPSNLARGVGLPRKVSRQHRYLTHDELGRLAESSGQHELLMLFLGCTGLRWGEATALRIRNVDFDRNRVNVVENAVLVSGEVIVATPKAHKRRAVPHSPFLTFSLRDAIQSRQPDDFLFPDRLGAHQTTPTIRANSWLNRALGSAGLPPMTIHDLRHTTASLAISAGVIVKSVQKMLGHASATMTLDIYANLFDDDLNDVAKRLNEVIVMCGV
nr:site-specific integrase [Glaciibacter superstes]